MNRKLLFYILGCLIYGCNGLLVKHIAMQSYEIVFLRTVFGGGCLLVIFALSKRRFTFYRYKKEFAMLAASSIIMGTSGLFLYEAFTQIGVSVSTLMYYCGPIIMVMLSPFIFKEKITPVKAIGVALIAIGIVLVNGIATGEKLNAWGIFCGGMSAICWAGMVICNKKVVNIKGLEKATLQICISIIPVGGFLLLRQGFSLHIPSEAWPYALVLGAFNTGIGSYFYFSSMGDLPVQTASTFGYLEPLTAVISAVVFLGEPMNVYQIIGAGMVIGGAILSDMKFALPNAGGLKEKIAERAKRLKSEVPAVFIALSDRDTPVIAKVLAGLTVGYALSPIDLIPDFVPVLGYLDDIIILPALVALTVKRIPSDVWERSKEKSADLWQNGKPKKWYYAIPIILIWAIVIWRCGARIAAMMRA